MFWSGKTGITEMMLFPESFPQNRSFPVTFPISFELFMLDTSLFSVMLSDTKREEEDVYSRDLFPKNSFFSHKNGTFYKQELWTSLAAAAALSSC